MKKITEHNTLDLQNLISIRATMQQQDMLQVVQEMSKIISESVTEKNGPFISGVYSSYMENDELLMDVEILWPVKQKIELADGYVFKPVFHLVNAVKLEYQGNPKDSQLAIQELVEYIKNQNLTPITPMYNITTYEPKSKEELDKFAMELYIGVSENIL